MSDVPVDFDDDDAYDPTWQPKRLTTAGPSSLGEESGEVSVRPFRTGEVFDKQTLLDGLRRGKLHGVAQIGLIQFLSHDADDDVRVVLGRQGEVRFRRYDPDQEEVEYWTLPRALTDTVAIRYSGDPATGLLRFTLFGGGRIPDTLIDWFQDAFAGIPRGSPIADALDPAHVRRRCFETGFLKRLYSIQAQLDAEGYETIDHTRFKSRNFIDPECKRMREFRAAEQMHIEAFESEVDVHTEDIQKNAKIRFTVRTESGNIRLVVPRLHYKPTIRDESAFTRAFYGLCERAVAEIVGLDAPMAAHLDPGSHDDSFLASIMDTRRHRAYLASPGNRARFFAGLALGQPPGFWLPHLRAIDGMLASGAIPDIDQLLDHLASDDPEQAVMLLATTHHQRLHRLGAAACGAVVRRLPTLPRRFLPMADEILLEWALDEDSADWTYDAGTDTVELYGVPYSVGMLAPAIRAKALLRCARDGHRRTCAAVPDPSGAQAVHEALLRLADVELLESDPPAAHVLRSHATLGGAGLLRALVGDDVPHHAEATAIAFDLHGVPLWPLLSPSSVDGRVVLGNAGLGVAADVMAGDHALGDLGPGATLELPRECEGADAIGFRCFGLAWRLPVSPALAAIAAPPAAPTLLVARRKLQAFRDAGDPDKRLLGQSEAMWRAFEEAYFAHRQDPRPHVLIEGETGTGKTEMAKVLHRASGLGEGKFFRVTGSAFAGVGDEHAQRGALLGYAPNHGFSGIDKAGKDGLIQHAAGGTLFVDDFEALPKRVQHALLDVLTGEHLWMEGGVGKRPVKATCRVILATNAGSRALVEAHEVRPDLLARVGARIDLPPLRERIADIFEIVRSVAPGGQMLTARAWWALLQHQWPENVRELLKVIKNALVVAREADATEVDVQHLLALPASLRQEGLKVPETDAERICLLAADRLAREEGYQHGVRDRGLQRRVGELLGFNETKVNRQYDEHVRGKKPRRRKR